MADFVQSYLLLQVQISPFFYLLVLSEIIFEFQNAGLGIVVKWKGVQGHPVFDRHVSVLVEFLS